jgi:hypothetical protein
VRDVFNRLQEVGFPGMSLMVSHRYQAERAVPVPAAAPGAAAGAAALVAPPADAAGAGQAAPAPPVEPAPAGGTEG